MIFALSEEQQALRDAARGFLAELPGPHTCAEQGASWDRRAWDRVVGQQGWTALLAPPDAGGWGFGLVEAMIVLEEAGRALVPLPLLSTMLGTIALTTLGSPDQQTRWLSEIVHGRTASLAHEGDVVATRSGTRWTLSGLVPRVVDGDTADVVVLATDAGLFAVEGEALHRERVPTLDPTRPLATLRLDRVVVDEADHLPGIGLDRVLRRAETLLAAEQVGVADAALELAVAYAKLRTQFGRPIGSFQAIQHMCADGLVRVETARSATMYAAWAHDAGAPDAALAARTAKALASEAAFRCAADAIQVHGGIGFTWEHALHLYLKRARGSLALLGEPRAHRAAVAAILLDEGHDDDREAAWI